MATRKMTFSLPEDLAERLVRRVPARDRSRYLAKVLEENLRQEEQALIRSCLAANADPDAKVIEQEWHQLREPIEEPWN